MFLDYVFRDRETLTIKRFPIFGVPLDLEELGKWLFAPSAIESVGAIYLAGYSNAFVAPSREGVAEVREEYGVANFMGEGVIEDVFSTSANRHPPNFATVMICPRPRFFLDGDEQETRCFPIGQFFPRPPNRQFPTMDLCLIRYLLSQFIRGGIHHEIICSHDTGLHILWVDVGNLFFRDSPHQTQQNEDVFH